MAASRVSGVCRRTAALRFYSTADASRSISKDVKLTSPMPRYVPECATKFLGHKGPLRTSNDNIDMFRRHPNFDFDTGKMKRIVSPDIRRFSAEYGVSLSFSPRHVLHPHDLCYLDPRGHARMPIVREKYERQLRDDALWVMFTGGAVEKAVVRTMTQRRMKSALYTALAARGYDASGKSTKRGREIRGTIWVYVQFPAKAAGNCPERFGNFMATLLDDNFSTAIEPVSDK